MTPPQVQDPVRPSVRRRLALLNQDAPAGAEPLAQEPVLPQQQPDSVRPFVRERLGRLGEPTLLERGEATVGKVGRAIEEKLRLPGTESAAAKRATGRSAEVGRRHAEEEADIHAPPPPAPPDTATREPWQEITSRRLAAGDTPEAAIDSALARGYSEKEMYGEPGAQMGLPPVAPHPSAPGEVLRGFAAGFGGMNPEMFGATMQTLGIKTPGAAVQAYGAAQRAKLPAGVQSITEIKDPDDAVDWAAYQFGQGVASTLPSVGAAVAGGAIGTAIFPGPGTAIGAGVGAAGAGFALNAGELRIALQEAGVTDEKDLRKLSILGGGMMAVLDLPLAGGVAARVFGIGKGARDAAKQHIVKRLLKDYAKGTLKEGITEGGQEIIVKGTVTHATGKPLFTLDNAIDVAGSAFAGGLVGGPFQAGGTAVGALRGVPAAEPEAEPGAPGVSRETEPAPPSAPPAVSRTGEALAASLAQAQTRQDTGQLEQIERALGAIERNSGPEAVTAIRARAAELAGAPAPEAAAVPPRIRRKVADFIDPAGAQEREQLRQQRDVERRKAETDAPTGLGRKEAFARALESAPAESRVVLFDLENLKALNDKVSMEAGDAAIARVGEVIRGVTGRGFRIGGDEFAVVVPPGDAQEVADAIRDAFGEQDAAGFPVRLRYGIGQNFEEADAAVRAAKKQRQGPAYRGGALPGGPEIGPYAGRDDDRIGASMGPGHPEVQPEVTEQPAPTPAVEQPSIEGRPEGAAAPPAEPSAATEQPAAPAAAASTERPTTEQLRQKEKAAKADVAEREAARPQPPTEQPAPPAPEPVSAEEPAAAPAEPEPAPAAEVQYPTRAEPMDLGEGRRAFKEGDVWQVWSAKQDRYVAFPPDPEHAGYRVYEAMELQWGRVRPGAQAEVTEQPAAPAAEPASRLDEIADAARKRLEARRGRLKTGLDPTDVADYAIIGAQHIVKGTRKITDWTAAMVREFGEEIRPYLQRIRDMAMRIVEDKRPIAWGGAFPDDLRAELDAAVEEIRAINAVMGEYGDLLGEAPVPEETVAPEPGPADTGTAADPLTAAAEKLTAAADKLAGAADRLAQQEEANAAGQGVRGPDQEGVSGVQPGREPDTQPGPARADQEGLEAGEPAVLETPAGGEPGRPDRVRGAGEDVAGAGPAAEGRGAVDRREGEVGAELPDVGAGRAATERGGARAREEAGEPAAGRAAGRVEPKEPTSVSPANHNAGDYHTDDPLAIVGGGPVARFNKNREAIEKYIELRDEGRQPTREEQDVLAGYTGWGSFGQELFQGSWKHPQPAKDWEKRDQWLREHLGRAEWEGLQRSITNAHYTDPPTVRAMWDIVRRLGFTGGRVLEPGMGIGNFFAFMPRDLKDRSQLTGIELDPVTGGMAQMLYPDSNIRVMGYQESRTPDDFYDVVIGNWPFEKTKIADRRYNELNPSLHDYYWLKTLDQVRPGGIVIGITSPFTMDKLGTPIRREIAKKAELIAAFRLPSGMFKEYAGTGVVADIIILRKRPARLASSAGESWIETVEADTPAGTPVTINEYYQANPQNIIGTLDHGHGTTTGRPGMIVRPPADPQQALQELVDRLSEGENAYMTESTRAESISYITNHTSDREGALVRTGAGFFVVRGEHLAPANEVSPYKIKNKAETTAREAQLSALIELRRLYGTLLEADRGTRDTDPEVARAALNKAYQSFIDRFTRLNNSYGLNYLRKIGDPFYPSLAALETETDGQWKPATILSRSTMRGRASIENPSISDAFVLARNQSINPSLDQLAEIAKKPADQVKRELIAEGAIFETPGGDIVPADIYLGGNVREKLRQAEAAVAEGNKDLVRNVEKLREVVPKDIPYFNIEVQFGATWIPASVYEQFVAHMLNASSTSDIEVSYTSGRWRVQIGHQLLGGPEATTGFGTNHYRFNRLVNAAISNKTVIIKRRDDITNTTYVDQAATDEVNARIADMRARFGDWLWTDIERRVEMEREYNEVQNAFAEPTYDGSFLRFEGMALERGEEPFNLREHQENGIWRGVVTRRSIDAHEVGTGKTNVIAGIAVESRRYGIAKKPLVLAHNANSKSVAAGIQEMYPGAKVLYIDNLAPSEIDVRVRQIANDDWDAIVLPHSLIDRLAFKEETLMEIAREQIEALEDEARQAAADDNVAFTEDVFTDPAELRKLRSPTAKDLVKARNKIIETIKKQAQRSSRENAVTFEDLGIDMVLVDEAHEFKKPPFATRMRLKGLQSQSSDKSIALMFMTEYIRGQNAGGNVHLFTGTPITNTITEVFHLMRYVMKEDMGGVKEWDGWFGAYARESMDVELTGSGDYEPVTRLRDFINVAELRRMVGQYMDVVFSDDMPEMQPRKTASGKTLDDKTLTELERGELVNGRTEGAEDRPYKKVITLTEDMTPEQLTVFERVQRLANRWKKMTGRQRKDALLGGAYESPVMYEGIALRASFDARLERDEELAGQEGKVPDNPNSKLSRALRNLMEIYRSDDRTAQVVFTNTGLGTSADRVARDHAGNALRDADGKAIKRRAKVFSSMRDLVERLVQEGVPREQIAIVDGNTSKEQRAKVAEAMNDGRIRIVIGSTGSLGVGVNMQKNLRAMHHLDAPWMPGDLEQRNGRGHRQGNQWNTVLEYRYITERLDGRRWQILGIKERFIKRFLKADDSVRVIEGDAASDEEGDILATFAEAAGDPRILILQKAKAKVTQLQSRERLHTEGIVDARRAARRAREQRETHERALELIEDNGVVEAVTTLTTDNAGPGFSIEIDGAVYNKRDAAAEALSKWFAANMRIGGDRKLAGSFGGQPVFAQWSRFAEKPDLNIEVNGVDLDTRASSIASLEATLRNYPASVEKLRARIEQGTSSIARLEEVAQQPFPRAADLDRVQKQVKAIEADLQRNPVPPPSWLRNGAPVETAVFWHGTEFTVTGHRSSKAGWFVVAESADGGEVTIPYLEAQDAQGMELYEERPGEPGAEERKAKAAAEPAEVEEEPGPEPLTLEEQQWEDEGGVTLHAFGLGPLIQLANQTGATEKGARVGAGLTGLARWGYDVLSDDLINVVRKQGRGGEWFAGRAEKALDFTKVVHGRLHARMKRALQIVSWGRKAEQAASWLQTIQRDGRSGFANIQSALEGRAKTMPPRAQEWVEHQQKLQWRMGKMAEKAKVYGRRALGLLQLLPGGQIRKFTATPGGRIMLRMSTSHLTDMYQTPRGAAWDTYISELARLNNLSAPQVRRILEPFTGARFSRTHAEVPRVLKIHPTHIYVATPYGERLIPLLETHPYRYTMASVRSFSSRLGFVRQFGQSLTKHDPKAGKFDQLEVLRDKAVQRGVDATDADNLLKTLSGVPLERPLLPVASPMYELVGAYQRIMGAIRSGMLTRAWVPNLPEFMGNIATFGGTTRTLRALAELATDWRRVVPLLERHGMATTDVANLTRNRDRWLETQTRRWGQGVLRLFPTQPIWNWQEKHAAVVGLRLAEDLRAKRGNAFSRSMDYFTLRWLGYSAKEAQSLVDGNGTPDEYLGVARRFAARSNTTRMTLPAEESRAANSRLWNSWMWFTRYPQMKARSFGRVTQLTWEALQEAKKNPSKQNLARVSAAMTMFARYNVGTAMSGAAQYSMISLLLGGTSGLAAMWRDAEEDWLEFFLKSWGWAQLGPIITSMGRIWENKQFDNWWMFSAPASVIYETVLALTGEGKYATLDAGERMMKWASRHMPGPRAVHSLAAAAGLAEKNTALDAATREYWAWRRKHIGAPGRFEPGDSPADHERFRAEMRRAYALMKRTDALARSEEIREHLNAALQVEGKERENVNSSIRARKLLSRLSKEERAAFAEYSPESYRAIEEHDEMLEAWARSGMRSRRRREPRARRQRERAF